MALTGDWARLQATTRGLRKLATIPAALATASAIAIKEQIDQSFERNADPYGNVWAEHASATIRRWGAHPLLRLTGRGKDQIVVRPLPGAGVSVTSPSEGLAFSQGGTVNQPARRFLPTDQFPKTWRAALERAAESKFKEALRGTG
jgi:hypothetical protein